RNGFNLSPDTNTPFFGVDACVANSQLVQPLLTVVDRSGAIVYGTFLSAGEDIPLNFPGQALTGYSLAADDTGTMGRAYIFGASSSTLQPTTDAFRGSCVQAPSPCAYLMVVDPSGPGAASRLYASYLWQLAGSGTIRLGPSGTVNIASNGVVQV